MRLLLSLPFRLLAGHARTRLLSAPPVFPSTPPSVRCHLTTRSCVSGKIPVSKHTASKSDDKSDEYATSLPLQTGDVKSAHNSGGQTYGGGMYQGGFRDAALTAVVGLGMGEYCRIAPSQSTSYMLLGKLVAAYVVCPVDLPRTRDIFRKYCLPGVWLDCSPSAGWPPALVTIFCT
jgi:hypothetical protein